jgi:transcriptional regulator with XRE-family HTH domain
VTSSPDDPGPDEQWVDVGSFIREQRRRAQLSLRKLSEMAGVSNPYLSQIERGLRRPSAGILQQIARALEISAETLYVQAGILDEPGAARDLVVEIRRDPYLREDQKATLVHIYESFTAGRRPRAGEMTADEPAEGSSTGDRVGDTIDRVESPGSI